MTLRTCLAAALLAALAWPASAQQRPLVTEDPEPVGAGRVLLEAGFDDAHNQQYTTSGLKGDLIRVPTIGVSVGISSIAELQIDGGAYNVLSISERRAAPLAGQVTATGTSTHALEDLVVATKVRLLAETAGRPAFGIRFATRLPNASNQSGLGTDTTDFFASLLVAKTVESVRVVGNVGMGILGEPTDATDQNDVLTYGLSFARAMTGAAELVGELNGRLSTRSGTPPVGTESHGVLKLGGRYTKGPVRLDGGIFFGMTTIDPTIGFTAGLTYVFNAFTIP